MGYVFLLFSLFAGASKGYCGKKTSGYVTEYKDVMFASSVRMVLCIIIGFAAVVIGGGSGYLLPDKNTLAISLLSGTANAAFVVLWLIAVKTGAYMMLDVFSTLGLVIPISASSILFGEKIGTNHIIGIIMLIVAAFIMCSYNNSIKQKITLPYLILLILCGMSNGFADLSQKMFVKAANGVPISIFNLYTYIFSSVILICCYFIFSFKSKDKKITDMKPIMIYICIMAVCMFLYLYFKTLSASYLSSVQLYPISQGGALILSTLMSAVFFGEKLNIKCIVGILLTFAALLIINLL